MESVMKKQYIRPTIAICPLMQKAPLLGGSPSNDSIPTVITVADMGKTQKESTGILFSGGDQTDDVTPTAKGNNMWETWE